MDVRIIHACRGLSVGGEPAHPGSARNSVRSDHTLRIACANADLNNEPDTGPTRRWSVVSIVFLVVRATPGSDLSEVDCAFGIACWLLTVAHANGGVC